MDSIINDDLPIWVNILVILANIINLIYNIPQIVKTYKRKSTRDISGLFLSLRLVGNTMVLIYTIYIKDVQLSIANTVTVLSSIFLCAYKLHDIYEDRLIKKQFETYEKHNSTITSLHLLILELKELLKRDNSENILVENMIIGEKNYKVIYLGNVDFVTLDSMDDNEYVNIPLTINDNELVHVSLDDNDLVNVPLKVGNSV